MLKFLIPAAAIIAVTVLLVRNNFLSPAVVDYGKVRPTSGLSDTDLKKTERTEKTLPVSTLLQEKNQETGTELPIPRDMRREYVIRPVACTTADSAAHQLLVGVKLVFRKGPLEKEIRLKEKNIVHLLKFVFSTRLPAEIEAEPVRLEIRNRINAFLAAGQIRDVIFTSFDIIPKAAP